MDAMVWRVNIQIHLSIHSVLGLPPMCTVDLIHFIISGSLCNSIVDCSIKTNFMSDHRCVLLSISGDVSPRDSGFWKFNTSLLSDKKYSDIINKTVKSIC